MTELIRITADAQLTLFQNQNIREINQIKYGSVFVFSGVFDHPLFAFVALRDQTAGR